MRPFRPISEYALPVIGNDNDQNIFTKWAGNRGWQSKCRNCTNKCKVLATTRGESNFQCFDYVKNNGQP